MKAAIKTTTAAITTSRANDTGSLRTLIANNAFLSRSLMTTGRFGINVSSHNPICYHRSFWNKRISTRQANSWRHGMFASTHTFQAIQSIFRPFEIHSNRRYKIYICSVILGQFDSFRNYQGFSIIFWKILDERGRENFSDSSFHRIFESENFRFPFSAKNSLI